MHTSDIDAILFRFKRLKPIIIVRMWLKASLNYNHLQSNTWYCATGTVSAQQRPVWAIREYYSGPDPEI